MYNNKNQTNKLIIFIAIALISFGIKYFKNSHSNNYIPTPSQHNNYPSQPPNERPSDGVLNRHPHSLIFTHHAKCRMACRHFDESEVREILENGKINSAKSNDRPGPCPTFALEGITHDGQHARMVFASCDATDVKVVTVIDLDTEWQCDCE